MIRLKLKQAGVSEESIKAAMDNIYAEDEDAEFNAAIIFAKKKKLGPFVAENKNVDEKEYLKTLAKFARAGFSFKVAKKIMEKDFL
jgi:regulatory protein